MPSPAHVFGVRHLSPGAALHVQRWLDKVQPDTVLIEGPADATDQLKHLAHKKTKPPVALLAFTKTRPVRTIRYPLASYSPEWVALRWALQHEREVRFIVLPAAVFLELRQPPTEETPDDTQAYLDDPYQEIARVAGEADHDTWWERTFEHLPDTEAYREAAYEFGLNLRALREEQSETLLREAYMRRELRASKGRVAVVCGAYHAPALGDELPAMTDKALAALGRADCVLTLMPYSYPRLSAQSGYGAGNQAPAYFQSFYEHALKGQPDEGAAAYLCAIAQRLRGEGNVRSSAEVIEALRLARGLASMAGSSAPVLRDLRDAAVTLLGQGEPMVLAEALRAIEVGSAVGTLPPGVSRTSLQDDFHQLVKTLRLEKFLKDEPQKLELDLREDRRAKTKEAAFLDRARSTFLNRLGVLDIGFAKTHERGQAGTSKEVWTLHWTPECEVRLAERSLLADSIEQGAALALMEKLAQAEDVGTATEVLLHAAECELASALTMALRRVQGLAVEESGFPSAAKGIANLAEVVRYGSVRDVDPAPLRPVLAQLYLRATLLVWGACVCDDDAAKYVRQAMDRIHEVAFIGEDGIDPEAWVKAIIDVAQADNRNPFLSGYANALLIERGRLSDDAIDHEVSRRLSPGTEASVGVGWFEGLVQRNRAALFMRKVLWRCLSDYVDQLDDDGFKRALLYLRRGFSSFSPGEVRRVVGLLAEAWKGGGEALARAVEKPLDKEALERMADDLGGLDLL